MSKARTAGEAKAEPKPCNGEAAVELNEDDLGGVSGGSTGAYWDMMSRGSFNGPSGSQTK